MGVYVPEKFLTNDDLSRMLGENINDFAQFEKAADILSKYNRQYTGSGDLGLIDGIRGNLNFSSGEWQGYQAQDFVAVIDLQKETEIKRIGGGFLQNARLWI